MYAYSLRFQRTIYSLNKPESHFSPDRFDQKHLAFTFQPVCHGGMNAVVPDINGTCMLEWSDRGLRGLLWIYAQENRIQNIEFKVQGSVSFVQIGRMCNGFNSSLSL